MVTISAIKHLRIQEGDIIVVRNPDDLHALVEASKDMNLPRCPIVVAQGSIHRLSKDYLRKLLSNSHSAIA